MYSSTELQLLRQTNKINFKKYLFDIFNAKCYQREWNKVAKGYTIDVLQNKHRLEALSILSYAFSASSGTILDRIFQTPTTIISIYFEPIIDHVIKTGTGYVILDNNNYVCYVQYFLDSVEKKLVPHNKSIKTPDLQSKYAEIVDGIYILIIINPNFKKAEMRYLGIYWCYNIQTFLFGFFVKNDSVSAVS